MSNVQDIGEARRLREEQRRQLADLHGGGGGGTPGGMEERVIRLEGDVGRLKLDVAELRVDMKTVLTELATLKERISHLPGKGFVVTSAVGTVGAVTGLLILLQRLGVLH